MKLLSVQIEKNSLRLAQINVKDNQCLVGKIRGFDLLTSSAHTRHSTSVSGRGIKTPLPTFSSIPIKS